MKFKFSLEKVLKQRQINVDLAQKDLNEAESFYRQELDILNEHIQKKEQTLKDRFKSIQNKNQWQNDVETMNLFLKGQDLRIAQQNERLMKVQKIVDIRREALKNALIEVKIIEKLKENKKMLFQQEVEKIESKELDEISSTRFVRMTK